jgi:hypothetical protein
MIPFLFIAARSNTQTGEEFDIDILPFLIGTALEFTSSGLAYFMT